MLAIFLVNTGQGQHSSIRFILKNSPMKREYAPLTVNIQISTVKLPIIFFVYRILLQFHIPLSNAEDLSIPMMYNTMVYVYTLYYNCTSSIAIACIFLVY